MCIRDSYWLLCEERYGREATVARLQELAAVEAQALSGVLLNPEEVRMHSVGLAD
jgi:tRNA-(ms[2]io[6]A)-hydroxylase